MKMPPPKHHRPSPATGQFLLLFFLLVVAAALGGCATVGSASREESLQAASRVVVGDSVTCTLRSGISRTFRVTEVRAGWLIGETDSVYSGDLVRLEVRGQAGNRVLCVIGGLAAGYAVGYMIAHPLASLPSGP
jgi:hypothetical protein